MDAKNRVTVPACWLDGGEEEFHAIPSPVGDCLMVMPPEEFDSWEDRIKQSGLPADVQRKAIRHFYSQARAISADSQGRILISEEQCEVLGLKGDVVLVGLRSRFEIWNTKGRDAVAPEETTAYQQAADLIGL
jgi:MraZ protein